MRRPNLSDRLTTTNHNVAGQFTVTSSILPAVCLSVSVQQLPQQSTWISFSENAGELCFQMVSVDFHSVYLKCIILKGLYSSVHGSLWFLMKAFVRNMSGYQ